MRIRFKCACGSTLIVGADKAGKTGKCPECTRTVTVPAPSEAVSVGVTGEGLSAVAESRSGHHAADFSTSSQTLEEEKASKVCDVKCEDCGATFQKIRWTSGNRCRICRSTNFFPVVVVEKPAVTVPGREEAAPEALSTEDVRFGRIARWARFVREAQIAECRRIQQFHARRNEPVPFIGQMMEEKGYLKKPQVNAILKMQSEKESAQDEAHFGRVAVANNMVTQEQLKECVDIRKTLGDKGGPSPFLCDVMIDEGYLNDRQVGDILQAQKQRSRGLLHQLEAALSEKSADSIVEKIKHMHEGGWRNNPLIAGVLGILCVLVLAMGFRFACAPTRPVGDLGLVNVKCTSCNKEYRTAPAVAPAVAPLKCDFCGERSVFYLMTCVHCGKPFTFSETTITEHPEYKIVCQHCNKPQN